MSGTNMDDVTKQTKTTQDVEKAPAESADDLPQSSTAEGVGRDYELKCGLINQCLQEDIGFGRYQWQLFILTGLGWMADNLWLQGLAIVLSQIQQEFNPKYVEYAVLAEFAGLIVGAVTWGVMADLIGRKTSFNSTLFLGGLFGLAAGGANNFVTFCALVACMGFGVGGNLPVDGALYLEHIPMSHQWTLTLLSVWWAVGQLLASLIAWGLLGNYSCASDIPDGQCPKSENMGWRYSFYTLGSLTFLVFIVRFFIFDLQESSKYLVAQGRDEEAVKVLEHIARRNGKTISITIDDFKAISEKSAPASMSVFNTVKNSFSTLSLSHIRPLFSTRRLGINTTLIIIIWGLIGLAYPLFNAYLPLYLEAKVTSTTETLNQTFRSYFAVSVLGIPGSLAACAVVDWTRQSRSGRWMIGGRKFSLAVSTVLTGLFLFLFTTSTTNSAVLGYSCVTALTENAMYGILYAYTPEVFPAPHRGTGDALCSALNRIGGLIAPLIKIATTPATGGISADTANAPVFISATLFVVAAVLTLLLPIETAGKVAL